MARGADTSGKGRAVCALDHCWTRWCLYRQRRAVADRIRAWGKAMVMLAVVSSAAAAASPDGTPEQALVEIALASKPEVVEKHLPESFREALHRLSPEDRALAKQKMLIKPLLGEEGAELVVPDDGSALLVMQRKHSEQRSNIRVKREINNGSDAFLELEADRSQEFKQSIFVWMRLENGEWRVVRVDLPRFLERVALDEPEFIERFHNVTRKETDGRITSVMYSIMGAVHQFAT